MKKKLTIHDLLEGEINSHGFGLYKHDVRQSYFWKFENEPHDCVKYLDRIIVDCANLNGFSKDDLQGFMDSALGRWAGDVITGAVLSNEPNFHERKSRTGKITLGSTGGIVEAIQSYMEQYLDLSPGERRGDWMRRGLNWTLKSVKV